MSIEVNATEQIIEVTSTGSTIDVNVTSQTVDVNATTTVIDVAVTNGPGPGVPSAGLTGQVLKKLSNADYDTYWATDTAGVPYVGATGDVDLGEYELKAGQIEFDQSPTGTAGVAVTRWNNTTGVTETTLKGGSVVLKNGVDLVARVVNKVTPNTTLTKAAYQAVRVSGAQGQRLAVAFAQANNDNNSADTIGLVTETIATNQEGFIITVGQLEDINTTGSLQGETWADGDVLYLSPTTAGALTNVKPVAPQHIIVIGYVEYAHAIHGKIYVKIMNGWELGELHDVNTTGATNGQVLTYNGTIWTPQTNASGNIYTTDGTLTGNRTVTMGSYSLSFQRDITINGAKFGVGGGNQNTNVAIGDSTLPSNTTGYNNVAIGNSALFNNIGGVRNVGIGTYVLGDNTNGSYNTAIGDSIYGTTTGNYNTFIGQQIITGNVSNNIILADGQGNMRLVFNSSGDAVLGGSTTYPTFSGFKLDVLGSGRYSGALTLSTIAQATTDTDHFLVSDSGVIKYRTGAEILSDIGAQAALTNPITGTGASGQVAYWSGTNTQTGSNNLFWDNANGYLGIKRTNPQVELDVIGNIRSNNTMFNTTTQTNNIQTNGQNLRILGASSAYITMFQSTGNLLIQNGGTFTDSGQRLQVNGTTLFTGSVTGTGNSSTYTVTASSGVARSKSITSTLVAAANNDVLVGLDIAPTFTVGAFTGVSNWALRAEGSSLFKGTTTTSISSLVIQNSSTDLWAFRNNGQISQTSSVQSFNLYPQTQGTLGTLATSGDLSLVLSNTRATGGVLTNGVFLITKSNPDTNTSGIIRYLYINHLPANSFAPTSGTGQLTMAEIAATINQTGGANGITRGLYINPTLTAAADWRSIEWSNNSGWGLYGAGTANNYLNGNLGIGNTSLSTSALRIFLNFDGTRTYGINVDSPVSANVATIYGLRASTRTNASVTVTNVLLFSAGQVSIGAGSTITSQFGYHVESSLTSATNNYGFYGDIPSGTGRWNLYCNGTANNYMAGALGIGTTSLTAYSLRIVRAMTGATSAYGYSNESTVSSDVTLSANCFFTNIATAASSFTLTNLRHYAATQSTFGAGSTVQNQYGFVVLSSLIGATNNYAFFGDIPSGTGRWNFYGAGTAANYLNGNTIIGGSAVDGGQKLQVNGTTQMTPAADASALTVSGYSVTGSGTTSAINLTGTFNTTGRVDAINVNITNTASNSGSNLLRLQVGGNSVFRVQAGSIGGLATGGAISPSGYGLGIGTVAILTVDNTNTYSTTGLAMQFSDGLQTLSGFSYIFHSGQYVNRDYTSGTGGFVSIQRGFAPTSGTGVFTALNIQNTINQTGGANGITRGLYINPTLTSAADWRAIEVSNGGAYINTTSVNASAILQADSTTKGFLPPRMTNAQRTAIATPAVGLIVYCTDTIEGLYVYKSTGWTFII